MMRMATRDTIVADAPASPLTGQLSLPQVEDLIRQRTGRPFRFIVNENHVDAHTDAGIARGAVKVWPAMRVAAVPAGMQVGSTAFAPVARAYDLSNVVDDASIDVRGQTVFHEVSNGGRELTVEAQFNPMPDPDEGNLYVINAGV